MLECAVITLKEQLYDHLQWYQNDRLGAEYTHAIR